MSGQVETNTLYGQPANASQRQCLLANGTQRMRHAAAATLALQNPDQVLFEVREVGKRQQIKLGSI